MTERKVFAREMEVNGETKMVKLTQKQLFREIADYVKDDEVLTDFVNYQIELLEKKREYASRHAANEEHNKLIADIVNIMGADSCQVSDIVKRFSEKEGIVYSPQKISAMMKKMVESGQVVKTVIKRVSYFTIAEEV